MHIDHTSVPIYGGTRLELALARALACQTSVITLEKEEVDLVPLFGTFQLSFRRKMHASISLQQPRIHRLLHRLI